jgi:hypothetical protein
MRTFLNLALMLVLCSSSLLAQQGKSLSDSELAAITARGRMLAEYDVASRHATDAVVALKPAHGIVARYIARKIDGRWVVVFGKLNETKDAFLIAYEATQGSTPEEFGVKTYHPATAGHRILLCCCAGDSNLAAKHSPRKSAI